MGHGGAGLAALPLGKALNLCYWYMVREGDAEHRQRVDQYVATGIWVSADGPPSMAQHERELAEMRAEMRLRPDGPRPRDIAPPPEGAVLMAIGTHSDPDALLAAGTAVAPPDPDAARAMLMSLDPSHGI